MTKVRLVMKSGNEKTGPIPVSMTTANTCPDACSFKGAGCYAEGGHTFFAWRTVATRGVDWKTFCEQVEQIPEGQTWRHNASGDLDGDNNKLNTQSLEMLVEANAKAGANGFTYTHKPLYPETRAALMNANLKGFTINVSHDSLVDLDNGTFPALPAVVVLPALAKDQPEPKTTRTPVRGIRVVTCPAQYRETTCAECKLCADPNRKYAIGFRAHGYRQRMVSETVSSRRHLTVVK